MGIRSCTHKRELGQRRGAAWGHDAGRRRPAAGYHGADPWVRLWCRRRPQGVGGGRLHFTAKRRPGGSPRFFDRLLFPWILFFSIYTSNQGESPTGARSKNCNWELHREGPQTTIRVDQ